MKTRLTIALLIMLAPVVFASPQTNSPKPDYVAPQTIPVSNLYHAASARLKKAGLDTQYDTARPFMFWTPSQMGNEFVGFPLVGTRADTNNTIDIHCLVEVNAYREGVFHTNGIIHGFPDKDGLVPYVQLDKSGKVETHGRRKPQHHPAPYPEPRTVQER